MISHEQLMKMPLPQRMACINDEPYYMAENARIKFLLKATFAPVPYIFALAIIGAIVVTTVICSFG